MSTRAWSPKGESTVLQFHFNCKHLSVIAGITVYPPVPVDLHLLETSSIAVGLVKHLRKSQ